jgi:hypothetical protein
MKWQQILHDKAYFWSANKRSLSYYEPDNVVGVTYSQTNDISKRVSVQFEHSVMLRQEQ